MARRAPKRRASAPERKPSVLRRLWARPSVQALTIGLFLLLVYLANGEILPGNDATANVRLAAKMVGQRKLVFTPKEDPALFEWRVQTPQGERFARFRSWEQPLDDEPVRQAYERGVIGNPKPDYFLVETRFPGVYANRYGWGAALFASPFVAALYPWSGDPEQASSVGALWQACKVAAASAVAASAVFLFLAALAFMRPGTAAALALIYGLGTCVWSTSSQTLWQHGPTELFFALGTFLMLRRERPWLVFWAGTSFAMAMACRPTAALAGLAIAGFYVKTDRRALLRFALGALPVLALFAAYNLHYFGRPVALGQLGSFASAFPSFPSVAMAADKPETQLFGGHVFEGVAGILVSPSRGLLVFSPVVAFAFWGLWRGWRDPKFVMLRPIAVAAVAGLLLTAAWHGWWGGWCYGYRLLTDSVTLLAFLAIPVAEEIRQRRSLTTVFAACALWSVLVQVVGVLAYDVNGWNNRKVFLVKVGSQPKVFIDRDEAQREVWASGGTSRIVEANVNWLNHHKRLWSLRDSQILYYLANFSESRRLKRQVVEEFLRDKG